MKAAVIGHPISHSLSPAIFRVIAEMEHSSLAYTTEDVAPENLAAFIETLRTDDDYVGVNVTIPHKEAILPFMDVLTDEVKAIGAANVIQIHRGKLVAHNTDVIGIRKTLIDKNYSCAGQTVLMMGAGGAARAMAYVLGEEGSKCVLIYNPRSSRGVELCQSMQIRFPHVVFKAVSSLSEIEANTVSLVVNCTPIGMKGESSSFFDDLKGVRFAKNVLAFDMLYTPKRLLFLNVMKSLGADTVDGLGMLIDQALATWEHWIGKLHHGAELRDRLKVTLTGILRSREDPSPLYLTGFMGIGKSTVARELSYSLGRDLVDTDKLIEEAAKQTISEIFETSGESKFRALEKDAIAATARGQRTVIALGGGALNAEENLNLVLNSGTLIYLKASESTLFKRLRKRAHARPLLADLDDDGLKRRISELLEKRTPIYERAQLHIEIKPDDTPHETAQAVLRCLGDAR